MGSVQSAIAAWQVALGPNHVVIDTARLTAVATATFSTSQRVPAILRPGNRDQVQECVRIANQFHVPLYPISGGKNWGFGSRVPAADRCVVLDLGRMNRIVHFDPELATITVEPGVTFRQVYDFLKQQQPKLMVGMIGGSPDASLIGNTLERGDGPGPLGDRASSICAIEVILPTGACIHTGFGRFSGARSARVDQSGVGPALDGMFLQSNLGIVTQLTMWLARIPDYFQSFQFSIPDIARLPELVGAVRELSFRGVLRDNSLFMWNSYKVLMVRGRYPWKLMQGQSPLNLRARGLAEPWYGNGALYSANRDIGVAERAAVADALANLVHGLAFNDPDTRVELDEEGTFVGVPSERNIRSMYWRKQSTPSHDIDPDRDRCGVVWLCPAFPLVGDLIAEVLGGIEAIAREHRFEPNIGMHVVSSRALHAYVMLTYDRESPGEDERALQCHDRLLEWTLRNGCHPYRLGLLSMDKMPHSNDDYDSLIQTMKQSLDPNDILSPGRYDGRRNWATNRILTQG